MSNAVIQGIYGLEKAEFGLHLPCRSIWPATEGILYLLGSTVGSVKALKP